ncbi:MAG: hypothetical protein Q9169_005350 [Polycauliona sp. 2 TL-2023]
MQTNMREELEHHEMMKLYTPALLFGAAELALSMVIRPNETISSPASPPPPMLSLAASLQAVNQTHVEVFIQYTYPQHISMLTWNSHFQSDAEHGSFVVARQSGATEAKLHPGEDILRFTFTGAAADDFVKIPVGGQHQSYHDLTRLFNVPMAGSYEVTMDLVAPAFPHSGNVSLEDKLQESSTSNLPILKIRSEPITMHLAESKKQDLHRRAERFHPGDCKIEPAVNNARNNAKDLARRAQGSGNAALWSLFFDNNDQRATVSKAYQGVLDYDPANNAFGITEQCDYQNQDFDCRKNARIAAYAAGLFLPTCNHRKAWVDMD